MEFLPSTAEKTTTIHEASFQPAFVPEHAARTDNILFVGTFEPRKNIPGLLRAFAQLISEGCQEELLGPGGGQAWQEQHAEERRQVTPGETGG